MTISLNQRALHLSDTLADNAEIYNVIASRLDNGTRLIDCGLETAGGLEAGLLFARVCMADLGTVSLTHLTFEDWWLPALKVHTDHPALGCMAAQYAGWSVSRDDYFAMGSGPARALIRAEEALYAELGHDEQATVAVLCLESGTPPTSDIADYIAERAGVASQDLTLLIAPTASLVGGVQVAARVVETGLHKLHELGLDLSHVLSGFGTCPLPPIAKNDLRAIGRTNDAILYGGQVYYTVQDEDDRLADLVAKAPAASSADYGQPFYDLFKSADFDFYKIDPLLFSPAEVTITNLNSGNTFHAGATNPAVLHQSFGVG